MEEGCPRLSARLSPIGRPWTTPAFPRARPVQSAADSGRGAESSRLGLACRRRELGWAGEEAARARGTRTTFDGVDARPNPNLASRPPLRSSPRQPHHSVAIPAPHLSSHASLHALLHALDSPPSLPSTSRVALCPLIFKPIMLGTRKGQRFNSGQPVDVHTLQEAPKTPEHSALFTIARCYSAPEPKQAASKNTASLILQIDQGIAVHSPRTDGKPEPGGARSHPLQDDVQLPPLVAKIAWQSSLQGAAIPRCYGYLRGLVNLQETYFIPWDYDPDKTVFAR
ncbi:hypothetical protein C8Q78DRAFT_168174 [Trametes maxima]|nr:hypothetical protein C8Q78DRAFT_168174 [Trametes maxima]